VAKLLTARGDIICLLKALVLEGDVSEKPTPFYAVAPSNDAQIPSGLVTVEADDGVRYAGHVRVMTPFTDIGGAALQISGVLAPIE
jgi:hypothetical protein